MNERAQPPIKTIKTPPTFSMSNSFDGADDDKNF